MLMKYLGLPVGLRLRQNQSCMVLLNRWNVIWLLGSGFICLRVVGSL
jgi:hypothetical protein